MEFVSLWIICAIVSAVIAAGKGRSTFGWFVIGLLFSIFGVIMIVCLPSLKRHEMPAPQVVYVQAPPQTPTRQASSEPQERPSAYGQSQTGWAVATDPRRMRRPGYTESQL